MKSFLEYVAADIVGRYGTDLSRTVVVFPNKRASLFLNDYLARQAGGRPMWSPVYITISDLFRQQSALQVADPVKLVCDLHGVFCRETGSSESLDKFYAWGQLLISDFDDVDKNMADASRVFANLRDVHELDDLSYLTDEQRDLLRHFFRHFTEEHESELKQRFLRLWSRLADIYHGYNRRLEAQGLAYEGALYRRVVERLWPAAAGATAGGAGGEDDAVARAFPYDRYLFVGFNLLQRVEQRLFAGLQRAGKARFYWDYDRSYMQGHEAGRYIGRYLQQFPNDLPDDDDDIYHCFARPKTIRSMAAPTEHIQARYVTQWLREQRRYADGRRTAVVLCDERLLPTVIHCLPDEVGAVNVTTGYPLDGTPVASFLQLYFNMQLGGRSPRLVRAFRRHPYAQYLEPAADGRDTPAGADGAADGHLLAALLPMLRQIAQRAGADVSDPLFQESVFRAYTLVSRLHALVESGDLRVTGPTLQRLVGQVVQQTSIPFHGEPAEGIQIMGVLETRNLDFDHVLLLSCNEGNMPRSVGDSSFIPHSLRQAYELTTVENKVSIYAYYFHRLLQRAADVTVVWNSSTDNGQRGELSRFVLQMMVESPHDIGRHMLETGKRVARLQPTPIDKTAAVVGVLRRQLEARDMVVSPSAINRYMRCSLQYYYSYVADIQEPDVPDDEQELDNRIFGNIFHRAADDIYRQLQPEVTRQQLQAVLDDPSRVRRAVGEALRQEMPHAVGGGLQLINSEVIVTYLRRLLELDLRLAPFTLLGLECDVVRPLDIRLPDGGQPLADGSRPLQLGGRIDRLDQLADGRIRVVDYKTGSRRLRPLSGVDDIFDPARLHDHSDYYLQTFVYADIVRRSHAEPVAPALLFIQHTAAEDYDPTLCFGRERIADVADYSADFNQRLDAVVAEMFDTDVPYTPTLDDRTCRTCPYRPLCRR